MGILGLFKALMPLILHIPHASTHLPEEALADFLINSAEIKAEHLRLTDWYTDELFGQGYPASHIIQAPCSRLVVDVERFPDDEREPCAQVGMGATYVRTCAQKIMRTLSPARREALMQQYYWPHHAKLDQAVAERVLALGYCYILDAHSYPTGPLHTHLGTTLTPEIGLGTAGKHTSQEFRDFASGFFRQQGYAVAFDVPFSGAIVPHAFMGQDFRVQSLMVEVRRDLYMNQATGQKHDGFQRVQATLTEFHQKLVAWIAIPKA